MLASSYHFEGVLGPFDVVLMQLMPPYLALSAPGGDLTLTVGNGPLGIGELKSQGPANVAQLLTTPQQKVDLIVEWNDSAGSPPDLNSGSTCSIKPRASPRRPSSLSFRFLPLNIGAPPM
ncbi:MAG TPA: hypothetical protein VMA09_14510 [Candidatus Binataceae bacterium]|nr:hypothetical protein [Candidatus Binataceae bacterium]